MKELKCIFPDGASEDERSIAWERLGVLRENELPLEVHHEITMISPRFDVRVILRNASGEICLVVSGKHHYASIIGGGIETGETIEQALRREAHEEAGYTLKNVQPLGYFVEMRHPAIINVFVFTAEAGENIGTDYTEDEIEEDFYPSWVSIDEAIKKLQAEDDKLAAMSEK